MTYKIWHWICAVTCLIGYATELTALEAERGILDLRQVKFEEGESVNLGGEWDFYWNQLLTPADLEDPLLEPTFYAEVPSVWKGQLVNDSLLLPGTGYGTYYLRLLLPPNTDDLALKILTAGTNFKVYANGILVREIGKVGTSREMAEADYRPQVVDLDGIPMVDNRLDIVVQMSNYHYHIGGFWRAFALGKEEVMRNSHERSVFFNMFTIGALFTLCFYHFIVYALRRRDVSNLFLAIAALLAVLRVSASGEYLMGYFDFIPWEFMIRIEFLSFYLGITTLATYLFFLFREDFHVYVWRTALLVGFVASAIVLVTPPYVFSHTVNAFQFYSIGLIAYCVYAAFRAFANKRSGAYIFAIGFLILSLFIINDIMLNYYFEVFNLHLIGFGLLFFMLTQGYLLAFRFTGTLTANEQLTQSLSDTNAHLEKAVDERTQELRESVRELKRVQTVIQEKNHELEVASSTKDKFFSIIGHDLRGPLGGIRTSLAMIIDDIENDELEEEQLHQSLRVLSRSSNSAFNLLENLFDWSRTQTGDIQFEPETFPVLDAFRENISLLANRIEQKKQVTITEIDPQLRVFADKNMVATVIRNLLSNAIKFTPEGGTVSMTAQERGDRIEISITDTGVGIEPERLEYVFEYAKNKSTPGTENERGTGIGLALCKEFVERNNGRIAVTSEVEKGSTFIFTLPKA